MSAAHRDRIWKPSRAAMHLEGSRAELERCAVREVELWGELLAAEREENMLGKWTAKAGIVTNTRKRAEIVKHIAKLERLAR